MDVGGGGGLRYPAAMAVPAQLLAQVMALSERDRLLLVEEIVAVTPGADDVDDPDGLRRALERSAADVQAGRVRPAQALLDELRATTKA
jgi:hypothetical protein